MKVRHRLNEGAIYRVMNAAVLTCICLFAPEGLLGIRVVTGRNLLVAAVVLAVFAGVNFLTVRGRILCLVTITISLWVSVAVVGPETSQEFFQTYLQWCGGSRISQVEWIKGCQLVQTAVITAVCYLLQILSEKLRGLRFCLICGCAIGLLVCMFKRVALPHLCVSFAVLYGILFYVEWLQKHWKKRRSGDLRAQMIWLSPFLAGYLALLAVIPAPENPYDWKWVKNIYHQVRESFLIVTQNMLRGGKEDFGVALSGFSEDGGLGEGVRENDREVMYLYGQNNLVTNVYLIGKVFDSFDGRQWSQEYRDDTGERFIDTMETLYAVRRLDDRYLKDYLYETNLKVRYEFFNTGYVFAPLKAGSVRGSGAELEYSFEGGDLHLNKQKGYGTEYDVRYFQMNVGEALFDQLLEARQEPNEALWDMIAEDYVGETGEKVTLEMVEQHRQRVYDYYLGEGVKLSEKAEHYLSDVIGDADSDIDKLHAIERELASFEYTRTPGRIPESVGSASDFLDYFLLESRRGYCTYFATAFVLLARAEGIPARYAQGFCVPVGESGSATVVSSMAHSWPEVYMEGVGWIPFEPTPGYGELRYTPWKVRDRGSIIYNEEEEELEEEEEDTINVVEELEEEEETLEGNEALRLFGRLMGFGIPAILAGVLLVLVLDNLLGRYRYRRMKPEGRFRVEVHRNLRVLSWLGLNREEMETLQELQERGAAKVGAEPLGFIEEYENMVYGGKNAGEDMIEEARKERGLLLDLIRRERRWKYAYCQVRLFLVRYR